MQLNYLVIKKIENPSYLIMATVQEKYDALSSYAFQYRENNLFVLLDLIREHKFNPMFIKDDDREDKILFSRIANIGCGEFIEYSIFREIRRVINTCFKENLIFNSLDELEVKTSEFEL